jgi:hypothetical protein
MSRRARSANLVALTAGLAGALLCAFPAPAKAQGCLVGCNGQLQAGHGPNTPNTTSVVLPNGQISTGNNIPTVANNPGDITLPRNTTFNNQYGAVGWIPDANGNEVLVFQSANAGAQAMIQNFSTNPVYANLTFTQALVTWIAGPNATPAQQQAVLNNPANQAALNMVQAALGANANQTISQMSATDLNSVASGIAQEEGYTPNQHVQLPTQEFSVTVTAQGDVIEPIVMPLPTSLDPPPPQLQVLEQQEGDESCRCWSSRRVTEAEEAAAAEAAAAAVPAGAVDVRAP